MIFPPVHDIADCELVIEESVSHCGPCVFGGVQFRHCVVEAVIALLIRRRLPHHCHCARHIFVQFYRSRRLWIICNHKRLYWLIH